MLMQAFNVLRHAPGEDLLSGYQESVSRIPVKICSQDAGEVVFCGLACTCVENALVYIE
jgi:hypothetical protein